MKAILQKLVYPSRHLGELGERRARWFYRLRGYRILEANVRTADGEIDLVVRRGTVLVFAEVKTRQSRRRGEGHEAVDRAKQERIARLASRYVGQHRLGDLRVRFDVLSLFWTGWRFELTHYANAFELAADPRYPWRTKVR